MDGFISPYIFILLTFDLCECACPYCMPVCMRGCVPVLEGGLWPVSIQVCVFGPWGDRADGPCFCFRVYECVWL